MEEKKKSSSRRFFIFYCVILFLFAAILIVFSYLSQSRVEQELSDKTVAAAGFASKLELANEKNAEYEKTITEQKGTINTLTARIEVLAIEENKAKAYDYLWQLVRAHRDRDFGECRSIIALIDDAELRPYLSDEGRAELEKIELKVKGV